MNNLPNKFSNTGKFENAINRLIDYCRSITPIGSPTVRVSGSNRGVILTAAAQGGGAAPVAASGVQRFSFLRSYKNYTLCLDKNLNHARVAKDYKLWNTIPGQVIYGTQISYTYFHNNPGDSLYGMYRTAALATGGQQNEGVVPQWLVGDVIFADSVGADVTTLTVEAQDIADNPTDNVTLTTPIIWLERGYRAWCRFSNQGF